MLIQILEQMAKLDVELTGKIAVFKFIYSFKSICYEFKFQEKSYYSTRIQKECLNAFIHGWKFAPKNLWRKMQECLFVWFNQ